MTRSKLIDKGAEKVRSSPDLLAFYIELYKQDFGEKPICAGCTFKHDWQKFINFNKIRKMETSKKTFIVANPHKIHTFENKDWKKNGYRPIERVYGSNMTEEWAKLYLTSGSKEQIEERKKDFKKLPELKVTPKASSTKAKK